MAVDLLSYPSLDDHAAVQEAAAAGLRAMQHLVHQLSTSPGPDCSGLADLTVNRFRKVISILDRTGHARFRRGPTSSTSSPSTSASTSTSSAPLHDLNFAPPPDDAPAPLPLPPSTSSFAKSLGSLTASLPLSSHTTSSLTGNAEGSVTGKPPVPPSAVKPPRCPSRSHSTGVSRCHCSSKRKSRVKRTIRVPSISPKIADIPADEYSWRKYGQKPIKGSPYPRSYYKCSTVRGCPARKHVERAPEDPSMLVVTYEYEHQHAAVAPPRPLLPEA